MCLVFSRRSCFFLSAVSSSFYRHGALFLYLRSLWRYRNHQTSIYQSSCRNSSHTTNRNILLTCSSTSRRYGFLVCFLAAADSRWYSTLCTGTVLNVAAAVRCTARSWSLALSVLPPPWWKCQFFSDDCEANSPAQRRLDNMPTHRVM